MEVYLAVPLKLNRDRRQAKKIYKVLLALGCRINSEWVLWDDPNPNLSPEEVYKRDLTAINDCDVLVADVTYPSIGVGFEIMYALNKSKQVICISKTRRISNILKGATAIEIIYYSKFDDLSKKMKTKILESM